MAWTLVRSDQRKSLQKGRFVSYSHLVIPCFDGRVSNHSPGWRIGICCKCVWKRSCSCCTAGKSSHRSLIESFWLGQPQTVSQLLILDFMRWLVQEPSFPSSFWSSYVFFVFAFLFCVGLFLVLIGTCDWACLTDLLWSLAFRICGNCFFP